MPDHKYSSRTEDGREDCTGGAILGLLLALVLLGVYAFAAIVWLTW